MPRIGLGRVLTIYPLASVALDEPCFIRRKALCFSALRELTFTLRAADIA